MAGDPTPQATMGSRWAVSDSAAWTRTAEGGAVVVDMTAGRPLELSPSGTAVWEALAGGLEPEEDLAGAPGPRDLETLAAAIAAAYGLTAQDVLDDVAAFLTMLARHGVVARTG